MDTKPFSSRRWQTRYTLLLLLLGGLIVTAWLMANSPSEAHSQTVAGLDGTPNYLPILHVDPTLTPTLTPTPTATPTASPTPAEPQFVKNVALSDAQCPNAVGFNAVSGYVYVANNFSYNVSAFRNGNFVTNINMGEWPTAIAADNDSALTYVTVLHDEVTVLNGTTVVGTIPKHYEPYGVVVNPVNGYAYITDLDSLVQIVNGTTLVTNLPITDPDTNSGAGWLQPVMVDPTTGRVYIASWSHGQMYVIEGTSVIATYRAGWGVKEMAIDAGRRYIYMAHESPNNTYTNNISVFNITTQTMTRVDTNQSSLNYSRAVDVDPSSGYAYFTNPEQNSVTVLLGTQIVTTLPTGDTPWDVGVNPNTGYVFVTNRGDDTITVIKGLNVIKTIPAQGLQPFAVGVDTTNNDVYIANRGDEYGLFQCRDASVTILR